MLLLLLLLVKEEVRQLLQLLITCKPGFMCWSSCVSRFVPDGSCNHTAHSMVHAPLPGSCDRPNIMLLAHNYRCRAASQHCQASVAALWIKHVRWRCRQPLHHMHA
jgi:hypothetical protein